MNTADRSFLMREAHKLAKTYVGHYSACLALALKNIHSIYADYKNNPTVTIRLSFSQTRLRKEANKDGFKYNPNTKTWSLITSNLEDFEATIYNYKNQVVKMNTTNPIIARKEKIGYGSQEHKGLANWDFD